ncbi:DUF1990 family protein [Curtobacterium sp. Leaf261]|uniref:DUF1990 family protein n=1 Tax=Curtobacterium sp. Leaf261 TaxID=1736311 RepID=UPI0006FB9A5E|nr:DUF1990 domain-containing protein [Curtobacterium sp. Leaf261]KQO65050.1 hypothetical protein ASF23_02620 [Curtobacterium sp. Leaf261]
MRDPLAMTYAPVGGSLAADLLASPPPGYRSRESRAVIGHGTQGFTAAADATLRWAIQERVGIVVVPDHDQSAEPRRRGHRPYEHDPLREGDLAMLHIRAYGTTTVAPIRVVTVLDEPARRGFSYGTLPGHPESGEVSFIVELRSDDAVELVIRSFSRPANLLWRALWPFVQRKSLRTTEEYLRVLAPDRGQER